MDLNKNRQDDLKIYNNLDFYEEPKEYFKDCLKIINKKIKDPKKILDIGSANGAFLNYLSKTFKSNILYGLEPVNELNLISKKNTKARIFEESLESFNPKDKYDVVTAMGVIGIFFDPEIFIKKIKSLLSKNGIAIILSPFNEENVDVIVNHRTSLNKKWESGNNVFSQNSMNEICKKLSMDFEWKDFEIKFQIKKTNNPVRNWTEEFRKNKYHFISGLGMFYTMKFLIISMKP